MPHRLFLTLESRSEAYDSLCRLWLLRLLAGTRITSQRLNRLFGDDDFREMLGLPGSGRRDEDDFLEMEDKPPIPAPGQARKYQRWINTHLRKAEATKASAEGTPLGDNLHWLGSRLGLSPLERDLLGFAVLVRANKPFRAAIGRLGWPTTRQALSILLAIVTAKPHPKITQALFSQGTLAQSGLLRLDTDPLEFEEAFILPSGLESAMMTNYENSEELLQNFFHAGPSPKLQEKDFAHLHTDLNLIRQALAQALCQRETGVNILLYGEPGVGKSEFARLLAASVSANVSEVSNTDEEGSPLTGQGRFSSFMLCQHMLANSGNSLVLFDEIEDVFPDEAGGFLRMIALGRGQAQGAGKSWINRVLETNPVPAIWIANRVGHIDPAYLRRFDYALEIPRPPRTARLRIAEKYFGKIPIGKDWIARIADWEALTPSQLEKAARLVRLTQPRSAAEAEQVAERTLRLSARLLGQTLPGRGNSTKGYRLDCLNTGQDIPALIAGLRQRPSASLCFHGPSGTGKTALAHHLAQALDKPVIVKRASDLLSKWVGEAEQNIARLFYEAAQEGVVLVLDEADGLLADRREASQNWELTQVNEMLTQMESFDGIFICTTNLLERLDQASLRRFTFKVRFDYLKPEQRRTLFEATWHRLNPQGGPLDEPLHRRLAHLENLTPGDFATVARQWTTLGQIPEATALVTALEEECRVKGGLARGIGFAA